MKTVNSTQLAERTQNKALVVDVEGKRIARLTIEAYGQTITLVSKQGEEDRAGSTLRFLAENIAEVLRATKEAVGDGE